MNLIRNLSVEYLENPIEVGLVVHREWELADREHEV